jgi:hypothetical protein
LWKSQKTKKTTHPLIMHWIQSEKGEKSGGQSNN